MKYPETFFRNFADTSPSRITILPVSNLGSRSPPGDQCTAVIVGCCRVTRSRRAEWENYPRLFSQLANSLEQTDNCRKSTIPRKAWASVAFTNALYPRVETAFISLPQFTISSKIKDRISHGQLNSCTRHEPFCGGTATHCLGIASNPTHVWKLEPAAQWLETILPTITGTHVKQLDIAT